MELSRNLSVCWCVRVEAPSVSFVPIVCDEVSFSGWVGGPIRAVCGFRCRGHDLTCYGHICSCVLVAVSLVGVRPLIALGGLGCGVLLVLGPLMHEGRCS
jgi:hypothetical protein